MKAQLVDVVQIENIPTALTTCPRWVLWTYVGRNGTQTKVPLSATTYHAASVTDPGNWFSFEAICHAFESAPEPLAGIGFAFSPDDDLIGIDLDDCIDPDSLAIASWALDIIQRIDSYTEISPSGTGVKIFVRGAVPRNKRKGKIEVYSRERFFTVTGAHLSGTPAEIQERHEAVADFFLATFGKEEASSSSGPYQPGQPGGFPGTDEELLRHAMGPAGGARRGQIWSNLARAMALRL